MYSTFWKSLNAHKLRVVSAREYARESPSSVRARACWVCARACWVHAYAYTYTSAYYAIASIYVLYAPEIEAYRFSLSSMKVHVARDALHANTLGLSQPRVDARAWAYVSVSVCARVISTCARGKELTRSPTRIQRLSECTIHVHWL